MSENKRKLLPCPFCGFETPSIRHNADCGNAWVSCDRCLASSGGFCEPEMAEHILRDLAAEEWNTRLAIPEGQFLLERLEEFELTDDADEMARQFIGHVEPAIARFRAALRQFAAHTPSIEQASS